MIYIYAHILYLTFLKINQQYYLINFFNIYKIIYCYINEIVFRNKFVS